MKLMPWLAAMVLAATCSTPTPAAPPDGDRPDHDVSHALRVITAGTGGPIAGLRVCAAPLSGAETCAATGSDGTVTLRLAPAVYQVRSDTPAGQRRKGDLVAADLHAGDAAVTLEFEAIRRLSGTVRDVARAPVAQAAACANPLVPGAAVCGRTNADGSYALEVAPGLYKLSFDGAPGARLLSQWGFGKIDSGEADVVDARTKDVAGLDATLVGGVVLSGVVTGSDGHALKRAQVCTLSWAGALPWDCERTDENGRYVALRERGTYWLWFIPPDDEPYLMQWWYQAFTGVNATPVELRADDTADIALRPGPAVRGRVTGPDGAPVVDALVCVDTPFPTGRICRPTDVNGAYRVTTRPETYLVQVLPPAGSDLLAAYYGGGRTWLDANTVTVGDGGATVDVALSRGVRVSGIVRTAAGVPLEGASVNVSDAQGIVAAVYTDATGAYSLAVPPGHYRMDAFGPIRAEVLSDEGRAIDVAGPTTIDVTLADANP